MNPLENIGVICTSLEKYYDVRTRSIEVKPRPVLIIGCEEGKQSAIDIDYELLPISRIKNATKITEYDFKIDEDKINQLGLDFVSYIRSNKTTWNHSKNMRIEDPIGDLKKLFPEFFNEILHKNLDWVKKRTYTNVNSPKVEN